jgi:imidazolonepropionase-like amidohydrolase
MARGLPSLRFLRSVSEVDRIQFRRLGNISLNYAINTTTAFRALHGAKNAREMLEEGFTTIQDLGSAGNYADTDLRRAIEQGYVPGPTIINSGRKISPSGGQFTYGLHPERPRQGEPEFFYADSRDEMRKAVRENILYGAKVIKIIADSQPFIYSVDDIQFIKDEAESAGLNVTAHATTDAAAHNCIEAGIASINHGFEMSDETLKLAKKNNVFLVGTDFTAEYWKEYGYSDARANELAEKLIDRIKRAYKIGVSMAFGSDVIFDRPGRTRGEVCKSIMDSYVRAELPAQYILKMMTVNAARLLKMDNQRGSLREGMAADIIATADNPLENIQTLKDVVFVMKNGKIFRSQSFD